MNVVYNIIQMNKYNGEQSIAFAHTDVNTVIAEHSNYKLYDPENSWIEVQYDNRNIPILEKVTKAIENELLFEDIELSANLFETVLDKFNEQSYNMDEYGLHLIPSSLNINKDNDNKETTVDAVFEYTLNDVKGKVCIQIHTPKSNVGY